MSDVVLTVGGNTAPLDRALQNSVGKKRTLGDIDVRGVERPLGKITGKASEFTKSLEAANARVIAFGASAGAIAALKISFDKLVESTITVEKSLVDINTLLNVSSRDLQKFGAELFSISNLNIAPGEYNNSEAQIVFWTNKNKDISFSTRSYIGGYFGGSKFLNSASLDIRSGDKFSSSLSINTNNIKIGDDKLNAIISGLNLTYSFTPRMFIQSFAQYNNVSNLLSINTRFGLLNDANTGLFIVFNILRDRDLFDELNSQQITIKYTHSFDLIK